jgi:hypothetical protein
MTLFLDTTGLSSTGFGDLFTISRQDGNLGDTPVPGDPSANQMTYAGGSPAGPTAARLFSLINTNFGTPIVVSALNDGIDPITGQDLTAVAGETYIDSTSGSAIIRVVYDASQCLGSGFFVFDTSANHITFPNPVLLYHELSHAFRAAQGTTASNDEIPAETDENVMRGVLSLCLRDVNNHGGGCGPGSTCGGTSNGNGCFIVSATTGSPSSAEVTVLRQLRDRVAAASGMAAKLIDAVYDEYYQFSPGIVVNLEKNAGARESVLWMVVQPLLAWYKLAGAVALDLADQSAVSRAKQEVLRACPPYFGGAHIAALLETIRAGESLPADSPQLLRDFAPRLQEAARLRFASWAILDPLIRVWKSTTSDHDVIDEVSLWLETAPLEALSPPCNSEALDVDLSRLAEFFGFKPRARRNLGARLAVAWPEARASLERHGFV